MSVKTLPFAEVVAGQGKFEAVAFAADVVQAVAVAAGVVASGWLAPNLRAGTA